MIKSVLGRAVSGAALLVALPLSALAQTAPAPAPPPNEGSLYLQCDGAPNNMSSGETAARLLGAVTLLGIFAKPPEGYDPSKRKFGAAGVTACTALIDGEKKETNATRRVDLILGRALHQIEAKDYEAAIADAALARSEAQTLGLMADPYYARSQGRAPDLVEAAALWRLGRTGEARAAALRSAGTLGHSYFGLVMLPGYLFGDPQPSDAEIAYLTDRAHAGLSGVGIAASRNEDWGRFADAAKLREALVDWGRVSVPAIQQSDDMARAAIDYALAGDTERAAGLAAEAHANFDKRIAEGNPEKDASAIVELFDLYGIIDSAGKGDLKAARRLFAARSQWVAASFGTVLEVTRRLRDGASPDELIGGLARDADALRKAHDDARRAETIAKDADNKTLFWLLPGVQRESAYTALSKQVWRTDKSKMLLKLDKPDDQKLKMERLFLYGPYYGTEEVLDAYALHAALLAKSRGQQGFVILPIITEKVVLAAIKTGNRGDAGLPDAMFNDAAETIATLSPLIPSPETLSARRK